MLYLFGLKDSQPGLLAEAKRCLANLDASQAAATSEDVVGGRRVVRRVYLIDATQSLFVLEGWEHPRTVVRVQTETSDREERSLSVEERYFISSLPKTRLTAAQWLLLVRRHWGVETAHQVLDVSFEEDDHPWVNTNPRAALVVAALRRIAYTLLTLFRSVTQRSNGRRLMQWKQLLGDIFLCLVNATAAQLDGLRRRLPTAPS